MRELLGDRVTDVSARLRTVTIDRLTGPTDFREYFKTNYGPTIATYRSIAGDPERVAALDRELDELVQRFDRGGGVTEWEYLLLTAKKA